MQRKGEKLLACNQVHGNKNGSNNKRRRHGGVWKTLLRPEYGCYIIRRADWILQRVEQGPRDEESGERVRNEEYS